MVVPYLLPRHHSLPPPRAVAAVSEVQPQEDIAERQVRAASDAINRFIDWLGYDRVERDKRPGLPMAAPTRRVFEDRRAMLAYLGESLSPPERDRLASFIPA